VEEFTYSLLADGRVRISHRGRHVVTLTGNRAATFAARAEHADAAERQLLMARFTGNFKRGNERLARERSRRP
jgi:phosphatidylserine/phosphatidylglycerophosphate/cardiolipin synthase-like enzyme